MRVISRHQPFITQCHIVPSVRVFIVVVASSVPPTRGHHG